MVGNGHTRKMLRLTGGKHLCGRCGFVPEHVCQMDVDHVDGDHSNNAPANLMVLCANCHRLKTQQNKDNRWRNRAAETVAAHAR
jgi:5-methylcytosine-specific restriction endonuclease McrA